ncbi:MAG: alcohol dehydrogenase catalytic domain-containing protein [Halobacteriaceae archaeon]
MRAAVLEEYGEPLRITEVARPTPEPDGVVVAVEACGVCRSDWHAWRGHGEWADDQVPRGQVLGHEPAGRIVERGAEVTTLAEGDRVAIPFCLGDGTCHRCRNGRGNICENGHALGFEPSAAGAFAEFVHVPHAEFNVAPLPDGVAFEAAAALGCRYATAYHGLAHRAPPSPGDWVAVLGCGGVGLSAIQVADTLAAGVVAVDLSERALERAQTLGADVTVQAGEGVDVPGRLRDATDGGPHVTIDALGAAETCRAGVQSLRAGGTQLQLGLTGEAERGEIALPTDSMTRWERSLVGARGCPPSRYAELFRLVDRDHIDPGALISRELSLEDLPDRLAAMDDYGTEGIEVVTEFSA